MKPGQVRQSAAKTPPAPSGRARKGIPVLSEYEEAKLLMQWANDPMVQRAQPELELLFAIGNSAGKLPMRTQMALNAIGRKKGIPDYLLPVWRWRRPPSSKYHGLFIELKRVGAPPSAVKPEQRWWGEQLIKQGYCHRVCFGAKEAIKCIEAYLEGEL